MIYYVIIGALIVIVLFLLIQYVRSNKKLNKRDEELELLHQKIESHQEYISILSQELRTPLYGIMGLTNLLVEDHPELYNDRKLRSLKYTGDYLLTLINNVLHVNYLESKEVIVQNTSFNVKDVTQNLIDSFGYATETTGNILHFDFDPETNQDVIGDPAILSQILMNFVSNSLRFTKNGNIYFSVNLVKKKKEEITISFKVKHDGYEITKKDKQSIYQEFVNIDKAKESYLGTGINATIVKKLADTLQGEIIIQNNSHKGSEYVFVTDFKIEQRENHNIDAKANVFNESSKLKALVVDDNKLNLLVADKILSKEDFDCTTIDNGFDAIKLAKENTFDIILMDINMPKLNGIGTTKRIREFDTTTPIIAITAVDVTQLNRQILRAGLNDYILKPYNKKHLLEVIRKNMISSN